jgi:hypothetical protein
MSDVVRSDRCGLDELFLACGIGEAERGRLLGAAWGSGEGECSISVS